MDNYPLEIQNFTVIGIITFKRNLKDPYKKAKAFFKKLNCNNIVLLRITNDNKILGILFNNSQSYNRTDLEGLWKAHKGLAVLRDFISGYPVDKQLRYCGLPVKEYQVWLNSGNRSSNQYSSRNSASPKSGSPCSLEAPYLEECPLPRPV